MGASSGFQGDPQGRPLFPYWPVSFTAIDTPADLNDGEHYAEHYETQQALIADRFERRKYNMSVTEIMNGPPIPRWWQHAVWMVGDLTRKHGSLATVQGNLVQAQETLINAKTEDEIKNAQSAKSYYEKELAKKQACEAAYKVYIADIAGWVQGQDPWAIMSDQDWAKLDSYWARLREFAPFTVTYGRTELSYCTSQMFRDAPAHDDAAYAGISPEARQIIEARRAMRPQFWLTAMTLSRQLGEAAAKTPGEPLASFAKQVSAWTAGQNPMTLMRQEDAAQLHAIFKHARIAFKDETRFIIPSRLSDLETASLIWAASGDEPAYASLPEATRRSINTRYQLPPEGQHQMFGVPTDVQGGIWEKTGDHLLLQLSFDDLMFWSFADNGIYQFWISPEDLQQRNWQRADVTFECH